MAISRCGNFPSFTGCLSTSIFFLYTWLQIHHLATPRCTLDPACVFGLCLTHKFTSSWQKLADRPSPPLVPEGVFVRRKRQRLRSHLTLNSPSEAKWTEQRPQLRRLQSASHCQTARMRSDGKEGDSNAVGPTTSETTISARCGASWKPGVGRLIRRRIRMRHRLVMSLQKFCNIVGGGNRRVRMRNPSTAQLFMRRSACLYLGDDEFCERLQLTTRNYPKSYHVPNWG